MIEKGSLDECIKGWNDFIEFQAVSESAVEAFEKKQERICNLRSGINYTISYEEDKVNQKYQKIVQERANADKKIGRNRCIACLLTVGLFAAWFFLMTSELVDSFLCVAVGYGAIISAIVMFCLLCSSYATGAKKRYEAKEWERIRKGRDYNAEIQKAREEDKKLTKEIMEEREEELRVLKNQEGEHEWLYKEWAKIVKDIRSNAAIAENMRELTDSKILEVVIRKMDWDKNMTYRGVMQAAKNKAIDDWRESYAAVARITGMIADMVRKG